MRLIYADEAGTSANDAVCVVAAVLVDGDRQYQRLADDISRVVAEKVPKGVLDNYTDGFVIHATDIFSGSKNIDRKVWDFADRVDFLKTILCLPFVHDVPIALGIDGKKTNYAEKYDFAALNIRDNSQFIHLMAFARCMDKADYFLRRMLMAKEVGTVICEDIPENRSVIRKMGLMFRDRPEDLEANNQAQSQLFDQLGIIKKSYRYQITNIVDAPNFLSKQQSPLLQLADVCAFAFRHHLCRKAQGSDLVMAMLGPVEGPTFIQDHNWFLGESSGLWNTTSYFTRQVAEYNLMYYPEGTQKVSIEGIQNPVLRKAMRELPDSG